MMSRCPHDGGACHHECPNPLRCFRESGGMALTIPHEGYPLPGHEIPECDLSLDNLRLVDKWTKANGNGYSIRDRSWIHRIVKALLEEVLADRCLTCGSDDCYCPNPHAPGGIPHG